MGSGREGVEERNGRDWTDESKVNSRGTSRKPFEP
jgi:hypothetical protein